MSGKKETKIEPGNITRRQFLRDAGIVVGGTAVGSAFFLSACGKEVEVTKTATQAGTVIKYICPICNHNFDSLDNLKNHYNVEHEEAEPVAKNAIMLIVNKEEHLLQVEPQWTLADILRNKLDLTGTKIACDAGACGACTVCVNGEPMLSCMMLAIECDGKTIETIEGLKQNETLNKLQKAFIKHDAMQCGYCTAGMLMSAQSLLNETPLPSQNEIKNALSGNLCRCGAYKKIIAAVSGAM